MTLSVVVTTKRVESQSFREWDSACGQAVREALDAAEDVTLVDTNGAQYHVWAEPVEDQS